MASKEAFEDHCWKDVMSPADMKLYSPYARETFVGPSVAFLAIDLYNLVYRGGPGAPVDLDPQYPNSCGIYAHRAIEPTKRLFAAVRRAGIPVFYCTQDHRPQNRPDGAISTRRKEKPANAADHSIYHEFTPEPIGRHHLQAARQHLPRNTVPIAPKSPRHSQSHCLWREHVRLRPRQHGGRLFEWISRIDR